MNIHEYTSRVTWIFMSTRHGWHEYSWVRHGWHEFTSPMTEYSWAYVKGDMNNHKYTSQVPWNTSRVTWIFMSSRHGWHMSTRHVWHILKSIRHGWYIQEFTSRWQNIHEHKSRVTELWVHVTGDMNIHEYMSKVTWILWVHFTGTWIFMITHNVGHEYSPGNIHDYTLTGDMNIHEWHILIPVFLIVHKSLGGHSHIER